MTALTTRQQAAQDTMVAYLAACKAHDMDGARNAYRALQDLRHGIVSTTEAVRFATPTVHAHAV